MAQRKRVIPKPRLQIPTKFKGTMEQYIAEFNRLNNLKGTK